MHSILDLQEKKLEKLLHIESKFVKDSLMIIQT